jgi:hypothetical protein
LPSLRTLWLNAANRPSWRRPVRAPRRLGIDLSLFKLQDRQGASSKPQHK